MAIKKFKVSAFVPETTFDFRNVGYQDSVMIIQEELIKSQKSFCKIGWYLKNINEKQLFKEGGYDNLYTFASDHFGISKATATRFINICEQFSVNGDSPELDEKYVLYGVSQLFEMLPLNEDDRESLTPDMSVSEIREHKNKVLEKSQPDDDEIYKVCEHFEIIDGIAARTPGDLADELKKKHSHSGYFDSSFSFKCSSAGITINEKKQISWNKFAKLAIKLFTSEEDVVDCDDRGNAFDDGADVIESPRTLSEESVSGFRTREMTEEEIEEYEALVENAEQLSMEDIAGSENDSSCDIDSATDQETEIVDVECTEDTIEEDDDLISRNAVLKILDELCVDEKAHKADSIDGSVVFVKVSVFKKRILEL